MNDIGIFTPVCQNCSHSSEMSSRYRDVEFKDDAPLFCALSPRWQEVEKDHWCSHWVRQKNDEADRALTKQWEHDRRDREQSSREKLKKRIKFLETKIKKLAAREGTN